MTTFQSAIAVLAVVSGNLIRREHQLTQNIPKPKNLYSKLYSPYSDENIKIQKFQDVWKKQEIQDNKAEYQRPKQKIDNFNYL